jgi:hypothetical protein
MQRITRLLTVLAPLLLAPILLAACYDDNYHGYAPGPAPIQGPAASVQFVHASPDAPPVNVLIDGSPFITSLDYGQGTGEQQLPAGSHTIEVQALTPGAPTTVIGPTTLMFTASTDTVVAAEGPVASLSAQTFVHTLAIVGPTMTQVQVLHAAPNAPSVSVFVTAPGADLASSAPLGTFSFEGFLGPVQVPSGAYEIRVTPGGATTPVLFDSGTISLAGGADLVISALQNEGPGTAPITLGVVDALGNSSRILDVATPANVRAVHASPNAPPVSVIVNGNVATPLVPSLAYEAFTPYVSLTAGNVNVEITPASNTASVLINQTLNLEPGTVHSIYAVGDLATLQTLVTKDRDRRYATQAKLRIIHGSPSAGLVDVYLTPPGTSIASVTPTYPAVPFLTDTGFVSYAAGSYQLTITPAGSKTPAIGPTTVELANAGIYTAVARDAAGGGSPLGLILLDDFAAKP